MQAHHDVMKIRGDTNAVGEGPDGAHALLSAFLEATGKIDRRAQKRGAVVDAPIAVNLEALPMAVDAQEALLEADLALVEANFTTLDAAQPVFEASPTSLEVGQTLLEAIPASTAPKSQIVPFAFRRANLVRG